MGSQGAVGWQKKRSLFGCILTNPQEKTALSGVFLVRMEGGFRM